MAEVQRSGASPVMAFILGALVIAVAVIAWFVFSGGPKPAPDVPSVTIEAPKLPDINMPDAPKLPRG